MKISEWKADFKGYINELYLPRDDFNGIMEYIEEVPERKHGKWIFSTEAVFGNPYGSYRCSLCGNGEPHKTNYCCNCGADMRGKNNAKK